MFAYIVVATGLILLSAQLWRNHSVQARLSKGFPLPPGPPRRPLVGNLFDIPLSEHWHKFLEWKRLYGEIVYVTALGNKMLVLNTPESISDLLESRHMIYSDRPKFTMVGELMRLDNSMGLLQCDEEWRRQRRFTHLALSPESVKKYDLVGDFVARYVATLLDNPSGFERQLRLTVGRIIMAVTYGIPVDTPDDLYIADAERTMKMIGKATVPGAFLVDLIPSYKYQSDDPDVQASIGHTLLWAAGTLYGAGGETTYSMTMTFILAMAKYPEVQTKLKAELMRIVGHDCLPTLQDRGALPYLQATIKEVMRWRPAFPLSMARVTRSADFYNGYYIPQGTIVLPNVWAISKDDKSGFPPEEFIPERHLADKVKEIATDPYSYAFGFGRRICPGRHLGDNMVFLLFSAILATVNISKKKDVNGDEIPLMPSYTPGLVSYPYPFEVDIEPASKEAISVIKEKASQLS
ncbi:cytochrome P450 [Chiua virens]|nr:cytochrome P450 [Chiua virens]